MSEHDGELLQALFSTSTDVVLVDLLRRAIWIDGDIDPGVSRDVIRGLQQLIQLNSDLPITLNVNSNGGSVSDGLAIADYIKHLSAQSFVVETNVMGVAYSAGALISAAGTRGHRKTLPSSRFLIHQVSAEGIGGNVEQVISNVKNVEALNTELVLNLADSTGKGTGIIAKHLKEETFMSAVQALEYGLVDHIISITKEKK